MIERYCKKCGYEICEEGDRVTLYDGKMLCDCKNGNFKGEKVKQK